MMTNYCIWQDRIVNLDHVTQVTINQQKSIATLSLATGGVELHFADNQKMMDYINYNLAHLGCRDAGQAPENLHPDLLLYLPKYKKPPKTITGTSQNRGL